MRDTTSTGNPAACPVSLDGPFGHDGERTWLVVGDFTGYWFFAGPGVVCGSVT